MATHSRILAWKIPWTGEPGRLQSRESWRVGHDLMTSLSQKVTVHILTSYLMFYPINLIKVPNLRVCDGQGGLACCDSWGHNESGTTELLNWTDTYKCHFTWFFIFTNSYNYQYINISYPCVFEIISAGNFNLCFISVVPNKRAHLFTLVHPPFSFSLLFWLFPILFLLDLGCFQISRMQISSGIHWKYLLPASLIFHFFNGEFWFTEVFILI